MPGAGTGAGASWPQSGTVILQKWVREFSWRIGRIGV